jgi:hypothetical protein
MDEPGRPYRRRDERPDAPEDSDHASSSSSAEGEDRLAEKVRRYHTDRGDPSRLDDVSTRDSGMQQPPSDVNQRESALGADRPADRMPSESQEPLSGLRWLFEDAAMDDPQRRDRVLDDVARWIGSDGKKAHDVVEAVQAARDDKIEQRIRELPALEPEIRNALLEESYRVFDDLDERVQRLGGIDLYGDPATS